MIKLLKFDKNKQKLWWLDYLFNSSRSSKGSLVSGEVRLALGVASTGCCFERWAETRHRPVQARKPRKEDWWSGCYCWSLAVAVLQGKKTTPVFAFGRDRRVLEVNRNECRCILVLLLVTSGECQCKTVLLVAVRIRQTRVLTCWRPRKRNT